MEKTHHSPQLSGLPTLADRATHLGEVPHRTYERDQEIKRDCMEGLVTPLRQGTFPSQGPPPPPKQALRDLKVRAILQFQVHPYTSIAKYTYFVTFCHITYLFLSHWIDSRKCFSTDRVYIFIIDK